MQSCYLNRFDKNERKRKDKIWLYLCRFVFQKYILPKDTVLDYAAGNCEFINHIKCARKIAIDMNPDTKKFADKNVEVYNFNPTALKKRFSNSIDKVFVSNFFEHLNSKEELMEYIEVIFAILKPGGSVIVLQPNIKLASGKYWDFVDHKLPLTELALVEAFEISNFQIIEVIERFLPFTTKNSLPVFEWMIVFYSRIPPLLRVGAGQSLVVAKKRK